MAGYLAQNLGAGKVEGTPVHRSLQLDGSRHPRRCSYRMTPLMTFAQRYQSF